VLAPGLRLADRAFTMAFIVWQSEARFSRSDTSCGFFPILFRLENRLKTFIEKMLFGIRNVI
jgi:hypothetical protein